MKNRSFAMRLIIAVCMLFVLVLTGCSNNGAEETSNSNSNSNSDPGAENSGEPKSGGTLRVGIPTDIPNLGYPATQPSVSLFVLGRPALETLGRFNEKGEITPWLAESWETNPEEETITFKLKQGIKFHDGTDFNAEAVKWNIEQFVNAKRGELNSVKSVDVVDESTVKVNLDGWNSSTLEAIGYFVFMVSPTAYEENGQDWAIKNPIGTGPFKLASWDTDVAIKFTKNEDYWQEGKPYLDAIEFNIIKDAMTAEAAFRSEEVDLFTILGPKTLIDLEKDGYEISISKLGGSSGIGILPDSANPDSPFADPKVRKAVAYAIDNEALNNTLLQGFGVPTDQWGTPDAWSYNSDIEGFPYDPEKAKKLLAEAGYPNGFKTKFHMLNVGPTNLDVALQSYLAEIGIELEIEVIDNAKYNELAVTEWDGLAIWYFTSGADLALYMNRHFGENGSIFTQNIDHPQKVQDLLAEAKLATDSDSKKRIADELQKVAFQEYSLGIPIFIPAVSSVKHNYVHNDGFTTLDPHSFTPEDAWIGK